MRLIAAVVAALLVAVFLALAVVTVADAACRTKECRQRVHMKRTVKPHRAWLNRVAACESGGNYRAVSPDGRYFGGLQFWPPSWRSVGGVGMPHHASPLEQRYRAVLLLLRLQGPGAWPVCGR